MRQLNSLYLYLIGIPSILALTFVSCSVGDNTPPSTITDLGVDSGLRLLVWTAPGDDGRSGRASLYFIRFLDNNQLEEILGVDNLDNIPPEVIDETVINNFNEGIQNPTFVPPQNAGFRESFSAPRLDITGETQFFYSIQSSDEVGSKSRPSNVVKVTTELQSLKFQAQDNLCPEGLSIGAGNFTNTQEDDDDGITRNDILIGDPCNGIVYVFFGRSDLSIDISSPDVTIIGNAGDRFGASVTGIGNFGGPGPALAEIGIGAPGFDGETGQAFIIFGNNQFPSVIDLNAGDQPDFLITGENQGDNFGINTVGFANVGRRSDEFFVGAPNANSQTGKTYRFIGSRLSDQVTSASNARGIIIGQSQGELFGSAITDATGIQARRSDEYAISSPGAGKVYLFFDSVTGEKNLSMDTSDVVTIQGSVEGEFGASVSGGGDIDEDGQGKTDLVIGAPATDDGSGSVFFYSGDDLSEAFENGTEPIFSTEFVGLPESRFGESVRVFNLLTPDVTTRKRSTATILLLEQSSADFGVGAPGTTNGTEFIFLGGSAFPSIVSASDADVPVDGDPTESNFGETTADLGDVNGDQIGDFASSGSGFVRVEF
ncbi:MAG: hypothetical protein HY693_03050, partial [Deltaproteobacteria bacterium]|nr:hypothetical protein [Deltaproteobacteria bacterium]